MPSYQLDFAAVVARAEQSLRAGVSAARDMDDLEGAARQTADGIARELLEGLLRLADEELAQRRPQGWRLVGRRNRNLASTVGPVRVERRFYRDGARRGRFLLDEELGLAPRLGMTPKLARVGVELSSKVPFRVAAEVLAEFLPSAPKRQTLHRLLGQVGQRRQDEEEERRRRIFEDGEVLRGERRVGQLFVEADGKWVHLQRTPGKRDLEMQLAFSHEGWEPAGKGRWKLKQKRVHVSTQAGKHFWDGFSARLGEVYDLTDTRMVLGGDGAPWVTAGVGEFADCVGQLDRFHLAQALRRVLPGAKWRWAYVAASKGDLKTPLELLRESDHPEAERVAGYLISNRNGLVDYRQRPGWDEPGLRSLGAAEGNVDKVVANRMCKRGMAWTVDGARRMGKVLEATRNGELDRHLRRHQPPPPRQRRLKLAVNRVFANGLIPKDVSADWLQGSPPLASQRSHPTGHLLRRISRSDTFKIF